MKQALGRIRAGSIEISLHGHGFFPTAKVSRVFRIGNRPPPLAALAKLVDDATAVLGISREEHEFSLLLASARRAGPAAPLPRPGDGPNPVFQRLQEKFGRRQRSSRGR